MTTAAARYEALSLTFVKCVRSISSHRLHVWIRLWQHNVNARMVCSDIQFSNMYFATVCLPAMTVAKLLALICHPPT